MPRLIQQLLCVWLTLFGALLTAPVSAQTSSFMSDIDIYGQAETPDPPNVLIILDNTANWATPFTNEIAALRSTIQNLPLDTIRLGLMLFNETGNSSTHGTNNNVGGAYVRAAIRSMDSDYKTKMLALVNQLHTNDDRSNNGKAGLAMMEAYRYFSGGQPYAGNGKAKTDWSGSRSEPDATLYSASHAIYQTPGNALSSKSATQYTKPPTVSCGGSYIIYISNGPAQDNNSDIATASSALTSAYSALGTTRPSSDITLNPSGSQGNMADEWARFMNRTAPEQIRSFVVEVDPGTTGQAPGWTALMKSVATQGNGEYFSVSSGNGGAQIEFALSDIFNKILAVNSVFSSASLPVSVNTRGSYLNQVFMGMFRPDGDAKPRWRGNLKQYKFSYDVATDSVYLTDADGNTAINSTTGFINPNARSYWTSSSSFFSGESGVGDASDSPDGPIVEKGGAAQRLRELYGQSQTGRKVYTCYNCNPAGASIDLSSSTSYRFSTDNTAILTAARMGVSTATERDNIINWLRGAQNTDPSAKDNNPGSPWTVRPSVHGDVLHSRPAVINYGPSGSNNVVVFYGGNDGMFRAINGNQSTVYQGVGAGEEFWSFVPEEVWNTPSRSMLKRLRDNDPEIRVATTAPLTDQLPRDYTMDGPVGFYQKVQGDGTSSQIYVYTGMRRGGRALYAFDVTSINTPRLMWRVTNDSTGMAQLGQTWSQPRVARVKGMRDISAAQDIPVIIMGGGYDAAAEDSFTPGTTTMGNRVYVLNALNGAKIAEFPTTRSVPSDVALVDSDYDGYVDRGYVADIGGNVYRIDFEVKDAGGNTLTASDKWQMKPIASLSDSVVRKVFFPPDIVTSGSMTAVMIVTGDREKPLCGGSASAAASCTTMADAFFTIKDSVGSRPLEGSSFTVVTPAQLDSVGTDNASYATGCKISFASGEKAVNAPLTVGGYTYFSTNTPTVGNNSCTGFLGTARTYGAKFYCQGAISEIRTGGGLPPSPVSGVVAVTYTDPSGATVNKQVPFVIGGVADPNASTGTVANPANDSGCGLAGCKPVLSISPSRTRKYWFVENPR